MKPRIRGVASEKQKRWQAMSPFFKLYQYIIVRGQPNNSKCLIMNYFG